MQPRGAQVALHHPEVRILDHSVKGGDIMDELLQYDRLRDGDEITSRSGRYALHYDRNGVPVLTDRHLGTVCWRAGDEAPAAGTLVLGDGGALQVEGADAGTVWRSGLASRGAEALVVTDEGDLELLSGSGVRLLNSRLGQVPVTALHDAAPAADIRDDRHLVRHTAPHQVVTRSADGSLRSTVDEWWGRTLPAPLARWFEQDGAVLTWRILPQGNKPAWSLCLVDPLGRVLWWEGMQDVPTVLPPARPHVHGGPELPCGGRLRHQSLTSPGGTYTLLHQDDGDLVLHHNPTRRAVWSTGTGWAGDGWAELTEGGDLVLRNLCGAPVWSAGAEGARRLVVDDDGAVLLLDAAGEPVWAVHAGTGRTGRRPCTARGSTLHRYQGLWSHSLTSEDGGTVLVCQEGRRLVLFGDDGRRLWERHFWETDRGHLVLDGDGVLRLRTDDGAIAAELAGRGDELVVLPGEVVLRRDDGTVVWRNGEVVDGSAPALEDFTSWMDVLARDTAYCATVIRDTAPDEALRRLGARPRDVVTSTWWELLDRAGRVGVAPDEVAVAAFALGPHTLLVEHDGWMAVGRPDLSRGGFAVSCYRGPRSGSAFVVFRDGEEVADHCRDGGRAEACTPEVALALAAMGSDNAVRAASDHGVELLCRTAGIRPTIADVSGTARTAIVAQG